MEKGGFVYDRAGLQFTLKKKKEYGVKITDDP